MSNANLGAQEKTQTFSYIRQTGMPRIVKKFSMR